MKDILLSKLLFVLLVFSALITGILTGWFRLGFDIPVGSIYLNHGAIKTGSFLGTVILIERIVAIKRKWLFSFPLVNVSSLIFIYTGLNIIAFSCLIIGSVGLIYVFFIINSRQSDIPHQLMWIGAATWFVGNINLLIFQFYAYSIPWWMCFLLFTIVGERLELSRFLPLNNIKRKFLIAALGLFFLSCLLPFHSWGKIASGFSLIVISIWLLMYDMVRKSIKMPGIHRFSAITLIFGYVWLAMCGLFYIFFDEISIINYDALIHSYFLGFVFSMIFAHAPIILPGVLSIGIKPYHFMLYFWVLFFETSLILRIAGGMLDMAKLHELSGLLNGVFIILFLVNIMVLLFTRNFGKNKNQSSAGATL